MIDVLLLGTGGQMPRPGRWLSSLMVKCRGEMILFDCGEGTQVPCQEFGWGFRRLSAICLSHLHADHVAGLPGILHAMAWSCREEPLDIFGPPKTREVVTALRILAPVLPFEVRIHEPQPGTPFDLPGGLTGNVIWGDHGLPTFAYRLDLTRGRRFLVERAEGEGIDKRHWHDLQSGRDVHIGSATFRSSDFLGPERPGLAVGFVTDTRPVPAFIEFLRGVDLLVCEATYGDPEDLPKAIERKHMTFAEAGRLGADVEARALWLTHFSPAVDDPLLFRHQAAASMPDVVVGFSGLTTTLVFRDDEGTDQDASSPASSERTAAERAPGSAS